MVHLSKSSGIGNRSPSSAVGRRIADHTIHEEDLVLLRREPCPRTLQEVQRQCDYFLQKYGTLLRGLMLDNEPLTLIRVQVLVQELLAARLGDEAVCSLLKEKVLLPLERLYRLIQQEEEQLLQYRQADVAISAQGALAADWQASAERLQGVLLDELGKVMDAHKLVVDHLSIVRDGQRLAHEAAIKAHNAIIDLKGIETAMQSGIKEANRLLESKTPASTAIRACITLLSRTQDQYRMHSQQLNQHVSDHERAAVSVTESSTALLEQRDSWRVAKKRLEVIEDVLRRAEIPTYDLFAEEAAQVKTGVAIEDYSTVVALCPEYEASRAVQHVATLIAELEDALPQYAVATEAAPAVASHTVRNAEHFVVSVYALLTTIASVGFGRAFRPDALWRFLDQHGLSCNVAKGAFVQAASRACPRRWLSIRPGGYIGTAEGVRVSRDLKWWQELPGDFLDRLKAVASALPSGAVSNAPPPSASRAVMQERIPPPPKAVAITACQLAVCAYAAFVKRYDSGKANPFSGRTFEKVYAALLVPEGLTCSIDMAAFRVGVAQAQSTGLLESMVTVTKFELLFPTDKGFRQSEEWLKLLPADFAQRVKKRNDQAKAESRQAKEQLKKGRKK